MSTPPLLGALVIAAALTVTAPLTAHHSGAGFNSDKVIELTGTIKEFQFTNPHTWIQILVENDKGEKVEWSVEWGAPIRSAARASVRLRFHLVPQ